MICFHEKGIEAIQKALDEATKGLICTPYYSERGLNLLDPFFDVGETRKQGTIVEKATAVLYPLSLKPYEKIITRKYLDTLCEGREDVVEKSDKIAIWRDLEEMLPPYESRKSGKDPVGLIPLVDRAYARAYKLYRAYSSAMRFHCAARWVRSLRRALGQNRKEAWRKILRSLLKSETGTYYLEDDRITIIGGGEKLKDETFESLSPRSSQRKTVNTTLF